MNWSSVSFEIRSQMWPASIRNYFIIRVIVFALPRTDRFCRTFMTWRPLNDMGDEVMKHALSKPPLVCSFSLVCGTGRAWHAVLSLWVYDITKPLPRTGDLCKVRPRCQGKRRVARKLTYCRSSLFLKSFQLRSLADFLNRSLKQRLTNSSENVECASTCWAANAARKTLFNKMIRQFVWVLGVSKWIIISSIK